jgi:hypothetical protein
VGRGAVRSVRCEGGSRCEGGVGMGCESSLIPRPSFKVLGGPGARYHVANRKGQTPPPRRRHVRGVGKVQSYLHNGLRPSRNDSALKWSVV